MNYQKIYTNLIESRKNRILEESSSYEKHHIIPRSMGGSDEPGNLIHLTPREHFLAHWLLWRIYKNKQMAFAFFCMQKMNAPGQERKIYSSKAYQEAKEARGKFISELNKRIKKGQNVSSETRDKIREKHKGRKFTEAHKQKIHKSLSGKKKSETHKKKISEALKGFDWSSYQNRSKFISMKNSGGNNGRARKIEEIDEHGLVIREFDTMKNAMEYVSNLSPKRITKTTFFRHLSKGIAIVEKNFFRFKEIS